MKVGVIGAGAVGNATLLASVMRGCAREVLILDRDHKRAHAVATDMRYGAALSSAVDIRDGDYRDLAGAALVMIAAGVNEKTGGQPTAATRPGGCGSSMPTWPSTATSFRSCTASRLTPSSSCSPTRRIRWLILSASPGSN